jgi:hypothetical protein
MLKDKNVLFTEDTMAGTKDGELLILTERTTRRKEPQDLIQNMDSTSIEHSSSDQECQ